MELKALSADPKGDKKAEPRAEPDKTGSALTGEKLLNDRSTDSVRLFKAYHHVKIFSDSMQAICDSLVYASADSTSGYSKTRFYGPVVLRFPAIPSCYTRKISSLEK